MEATATTAARRAPPRPLGVRTGAASNRHSLAAPMWHVRLLMTSKEAVAQYWCHLSTPRAQPSAQRSASARRAKRCCVLERSRAVRPKE
jgi:hypothetical protein